MSSEDNTCEKCRIRKPSIFSSLNNKELSSVGGVIQTLRFNKKAVIFSENAPITDICHVKNGVIKIYKSRQDGRQQIVKLCFPGDVLGLDSIFSRHYLSTAKAVTESVICKIPKKNFLSFIDQNRKFSLKLLQITSQELAFSQKQIFNFGLKTAQERMADFLICVYNSQCDSKASSRKINLYIAHQEMAELLGVYPETVSRILTQFKRANFIQYKIPSKGITLLDPLALSKLALRS